MLAPFFLPATIITGNSKTKYLYRRLQNVEGFQCEIFVLFEAIQESQDEDSYKRSNILFLKKYRLCEGNVKHSERNESMYVGCRAHNEHFTVPVQYKGRMKTNCRGTRWLVTGSGD